MPAKKVAVKKTVATKKVVGEESVTRGPAAAVSRRASSVVSPPAGARREPSSASPLVAKTPKKAAGSLSVPVYSLVGKAAGSLELPKELFGVKVNQALLAQATRVYMNNQKTHFGSTKTRGEVEGSTRKIYKQKGTGGARHGAKYAPLFVGGGIAMGPKYRKVSLELPKKMKTQALISSLSQKMKEDKVLALLGLDKASGKTKEMASMFKTIDKKLKSALIVTGEKNDQAVRAVRNIEGIDVLPASLLNAFEVIKHHSLILTKEAIDGLQERLTKNA